MKLKHGLVHVQLMSFKIIRSFHIFQYWLNSEKHAQCSLVELNILPKTTEKF